MHPSRRSFVLSLFLTLLVSTIPSYAPAIFNSSYGIGRALGDDILRGLINASFVMSPGESPAPAKRHSSRERYSTLPCENKVVGETDPLPTADVMCLILN